MKKKMNIVVLAGGISTERDVSLSSSTMIQNSLIDSGYNAIIVDAYLGYELNYNTIEEEFNNAKKSEVIKVSENNISIENIKETNRLNNDGYFGKNVLALCKYADIVFIGLHGEDGENGKIQATFDMLGIKYTGTNSLGSSLAMNKELSKQIFISNGINTAEYISVTKDKKNVNDIKFPCVVKPTCGGSSVGVSIVYSKEELNNALNIAFKYENKIIIEDFIKGREFSVGILDGKSLPIIEIIPNEGFYDYKNKYQIGKTTEICPANLNRDLTIKMQQIALEVYKSLSLSVYARVDFIMMPNESMYCLEANTLPGMTPTSLLPQEAKAIGIEYAELCKKIIGISLKKYNNV